MRDQLEKICNTELPHRTRLDLAPSENTVSQCRIGDASCVILEYHPLIKKSNTWRAQSTLLVSDILIVRTDLILLQKQY